MIKNLCTPALMYFAFSMVQILIDIFKGIYNIAFFKFITMIIFIALLQILCIRGLGLISWIIVFIPFVLMTYVSMLLMYAFGFSENTILDTSNRNRKQSEIDQTDNTIETGKLHQRRLNQDKETIETK